GPARRGPAWHGMGRGPSSDTRSRQPFSRQARHGAATHGVARRGLAWHGRGAAVPRQPPALFSYLRGGRSHPPMKKPDPVTQKALELAAAVSFRIARRFADTDAEAARILIQAVDEELRARPELGLPPGMDFRT